MLENSKAQGTKTYSSLEIEKVKHQRYVLCENRRDATMNNQQETKEE